MDENKDLFEAENLTEQGVSGETINEESVSEDETNNIIPQFEPENESESNDTESVSD